MHGNKLAGKHHIRSEILQCNFLNNLLNYNALKNQLFFFTFTNFVYRVGVPGKSLKF